MKLSKSKFETILLILLMYTAIFEKIVWILAGFRVSLFMLVGMFVIVYVFLTNRMKFDMPISFIKLMINRLLLLAIILAQIFVVLKSSDIANQYIKGVFENLLNTLIFFSATYLITRNKKYWDFDKCLCTFAGCGILNAIYNLIQLFYNDIDQVIVSIFHSQVARYGLDSYGEIGRITGLFTDSNNNGVFILLSLIVLLYVVQNNVDLSKCKKRFYYFCIVLVLIELILCFSRTAWLGAVIFLLLYAINSNASRFIKIAFVGMVMGVILVVVYNNNIAFQSIIEERFSTMSLTTIINNTHFPILIYAVNIWCTNLVTFFFGVGVNCLSVYYETEYNLPGYKAHNYYLQNLCEVGVVGLFIIMCFYARLFRVIAVYGKGKQKFFLYSLLICLMIVNITYDSMVQPLLYLVFMLIVSLLNISNVESERTIKC